MKAIILGAILGFGSIAPSLAADLPARPVFSSGFLRSYRIRLDGPLCRRQWRIWKGSGLSARLRASACLSKRAATMPEEASRVADGISLAIRRSSDGLGAGSPGRLG